ncbi:MAG TPA: hypothetical protein DHV55_03770, partial [Clostridiaceae bacterium]|nr:hypothetical protein [Clostridiaceae bacterium]
KPKEPEQAAEQKPNEKPADSASTPNSNEQLTIGVSVNALSNVHNREVFELTEKSIIEAGHKAVMVNANGIAVQQVNDIENLIQQKADVIIIQNGDTDALKNVVQEARKAGIHIISMESGWIPGTSAMFALNDFTIGAKLYSMLAAEIGYEGEIICINHNDHPAIRARRNVQEAVLKEYRNIKNVNTVTSGFPGTVEIAYKGVESALQANPNVKAIWATFDLEAIGAAQAVKAAGRNDIIIAGVDGEKDALQMIKEGGPIIATVVGDQAATTKKAVEVAEKLARGEETQKFYEIPFEIVTKENIDKYID